MQVNVNWQITMPHHLGAKRPQERGARRLAQKIIWVHKITYYALLLVRDWLSYIMGTFCI